MMQENNGRIGSDINEGRETILNSYYILMDLIDISGTNAVGGDIVNPDTLGYIRNEASRLYDAAVRLNDDTSRVVLKYMALQFCALVSLAANIDDCKDSEAILGMVLQFAKAAANVNCNSGIQAYLQGCGKAPKKVIPKRKLIELA